MKLVLLVCVLPWIFLCCSSNQQVEKEELLQVPDCMKLQLKEAKQYVWGKRVRLDDGNFEHSEVKNRHMDLTWIGYFQIPGSEKDQFKLESTPSDKSKQTWIRKNEETGLQKLITTTSSNGQCTHATALVIEKNMLFERKLNLNARFQVADTSAIFTISGYQKIIFSEPVNFLVTYYALQP